MVRPSASINPWIHSYAVFVNACPAKWSSWIALAEFWYNASPHSALGCSPFEALYGYLPRHFGISVLDDVVIPELSSWLQDR